MVPRDRPHRLEAPHQTSTRQRRQHVVHRLMRHLTEVATRGTDEEVRVGVRMLVHRPQHRYSSTRNPQTGLAQSGFEIQHCRHTRSLAYVLDQIKNELSRVAGRSVRPGGRGHRAIEAPGSVCALQHHQGARADGDRGTGLPLL